MTDSRVVKLARLLVEYSLYIKKGDLFLIRGEPETLPLVKEAFKHALRLGAHPFVRVQLDEINEIFLKQASRRQLEYVSPVAKFEIEKIDARLIIGGSTNTKTLAGVDPQTFALRRRATRPLMERVFLPPSKGGVKWTYVYFPTNADAQEAGMSLSEWEDFVFNACLVNKKDPVKEWKKLRARQKRIARLLSKIRTLRFVSRGTDLTMSTRGRKWINSYGAQNMPDGEVFTSPVEDTLQGTISFSFSSERQGRIISDIRLTFKDGKVVHASASTNEELLHAALNTDRGARFCGEISFGTNPGVKRFVYNTLFDEKMGGTIHLALGNAYGEAGGKNTSAVHWDMVTDMRSDGEVYGDGELIYRKGKFLES